ncbi:hypothetical protein VE04_05050 [Pseudogymnoascus sp. 24MN13]|nr:hypothetical protein VE04_05050 [Pseudogymnoascus sp. 24MN13]
MAPVEDVAPPLFERFLASVLKPAGLICYCYYYLLITFLQWPLLAFQDLQAFRHRAFSRVWGKVGAELSQQLEGNTFDMLKTASGVVLDVGPGTGEILCRLDPALITKAYGVEPAVDMHPALQKNINKAGLAGKYEIVSCGAEPATLIPALDKLALLKTEGRSNEGIFDTILCIRVLCSVPNQQDTVNELYRLLKPGGRLIVCEHIASPWPGRASVVAWILQKLWILAGWNVLMGGCKLNRGTVGALEAAGGGDRKGWKKIDIGYWETWHPIPFVVGELVKI